MHAGLDGEKVETIYSLNQISRVAVMKTILTIYSFLLQKDRMPDVSSHLRWLKGRLTTTLSYEPHNLRSSTSGCLGFFQKSPSSNSKMESGKSIGKIKTASISMVYLRSINGLVYFSILFRGMKSCKWDTIKPLKRDSSGSVY